MMSILWVGSEDRTVAVLGVVLLLGVWLRLLRGRATRELKKGREDAGQMGS